MPSLKKCPKGSEPRRHDPGGGAGAVEALIDRAVRVSADAGAPSTLGNLQDLSARLAGRQLQLAVLGQFKRGKSTLLNALMGTDVLPMGVLPLTAIPTFLSYAEAPSLTVAFEDGREEAIAGVNTPETASARLREFVTEDGNPGNVKGVARVRLTLPCGLIQDGVTLIDTPGVGSTLEHNTKTAEATLPACDAALFVLSPDPPITEVEADYLVRIAQAAQRVILVLNKIDLVDPVDGEAVLGFIRRALPKEIAEATPIFPVSAQAALNGKLQGDADAVAKSGLPDLEAFLRELLAREKDAVLNTAIGQKAFGQVQDLAFQTRLRLQSLRLPLTDLEKRREIFERAAVDIETQHRIVGDLASADRRRLLAALDEQAEQLRAKVTARLEAELDQRIANHEDPTEAQRTVRDGAPAVLDAELRASIDETRSQVNTQFVGHEARRDELLELVQHTAAQIMDVPVQPRAPTAAFEARFSPYWAVTRPEALNPLPPGALDRLMPPSMRLRQARKRARVEFADIALRNVENLRWAMRQNIEAAFQRFAIQSDAAFAASLAATRDVMSAAAKRRSEYGAEVVSEIEALEATAGELDEIAVTLKDLANPRTPAGEEPS